MSAVGNEMYEKIIADLRAQLENVMRCNDNQRRQIEGLQADIARLKGMITTYANENARG